MSHIDDILKTLKQAIPIDTSRSDGLFYKKYLDLFKQKLIQKGFDVKLIDFPKNIDKTGNRYHLLASFKKSDDFGYLVFYGHIDTVPASESYKNKAFVFKKDDKYVYGRGSADQKGAHIAVFHALLDLDLSKINKNIIFYLTTDEETDQEKQLDFVWENYLSKIKQKIVFFDTDTLAGGITIANMGALILELETKGQSAHSASFSGKNALEDMIFLLSFIKTSIGESLNKLVSKYPFFKDYNIGQARGKLNINILHSGIAANVLPDTAKSTLDIRFIPDCDQENLEKNIIDDIKEFCDKNNINIKINKKISLRSFMYDLELSKKLEQTYSIISGQKGLFCVPGSAEISGFLSKHNIPAIGLGVIRKDSNIHADNEKVLITDLSNLYKTVQNFLLLPE